MTYGRMEKENEGELRWREVSKRENKKERDLIILFAFNFSPFIL